MSRYRILGWLFLTGLLLGARSPLQGEQLFTLTHPAMGTIFTLYLYDESQEQAELHAEPVFDEIDRIEELLSNYRESSELSRLNRLAASEILTTDPETFDFLSRSLEWSARSQGAFDITVGKLMKAWGFFRKRGHIPSENELATVRQETGWQKVQLDRATRGVHFTAAGVELDPGGIGKGYAVDKAVAILRTEKISAAMLSAGGSTIYAIGAPPGQQGWKIEVPDPIDRKRILSTVVLRDTSLSSANCIEKNFVLEGHLYCHIMDPATLRPVEGMLQVTIIDPSATDSDALSNVLFVKGAKADATVMKSLPSDSALVIAGSSKEAHCFLFHWQSKMNPGNC
jgi:thiamine biosynthesis lipoprotein